MQNGMVAITGRTFPVRAKLAALGGKWDKDGQCWLVPAEKADEARQVVNTPVAEMAKPEGVGHWTKVGGDWCVCVPTVLVDGAKAKVMTKAGKVMEETVGRLVRSDERGHVYTVVRIARDAR